MIYAISSSSLLSHTNRAPGFEFGGELQQISKDFDSRALSLVESFIVHIVNKQPHSSRPSSDSHSSPRRALPIGHNRARARLLPIDIFHLDHSSAVLCAAKDSLNGL